MESIVYVDRLKLSADEQIRQFDAAASEIGLVKRIQSARTVFIKPNLTYPVFKRGVTTRVEFIESVIGMLLRANRKLKIFVGEGEGGYNSFSMSDAMKRMGYEDLPRRHSNVEIINLSRLPSREVTLDSAKGPYTIQLPEIFSKEIDFSISCPLPKIHAMTKLTLSLKNLWGCLPDVMRLKNHYMFPYIISKLAGHLKFEFAFLDGKYGLNENGPMDGKATEVNWFVAANSLGAFDVTVSRMMGFAWKNIRHLKIAHDYGLIPSPQDTKLIGNPDMLAQRFYLKRELWAYPAFVAFHSKRLTQFFYFSKYADFMHDVMYTFRRRPMGPQFNEGRGT